MSYNYTPNYQGGNRGRGAPNFSSPFGPGPATNSPNNGGYQNNQNQGYQNQTPRGRSGGYNNNTPRGYGGYQGNRGGYDNNRRGGWTPRGGDQQNRGRGRGGWVPRGKGNDRGGRGGNHSGSQKRPHTNSAEIDAKEYLMPQMWGNPWAKLEAEYQKEYGTETSLAN